MKEEKLNYLIDKHLRGIGSQSEESTLKSWLSESEDNQSHFDQIERIHQEIKHLPLELDLETDNQWAQLQASILKESSTSSEAKVVRMSPFRQLWRVAAMLVLVAGIGWFVQDRLFNASLEIANEYQTEKGATQVFELADGSKIHLNADSKLSVFEKFNEKNRLLQLEGEAFFEVAKNAKLPFIIQTGQVQTEVTGTAFNLKAYPENDDVLLTVVEGSVNFKSDNQLVGIKANLAASFDKAAQKIEQVAFEEDVFAWRQGQLILENMSLEESLKAIERRFDVEFSNYSIITNRSIRLIINKEDTLEDVLEALEDILSIKTEQQDKTIQFSK